MRTLPLLTAILLCAPACGPAAPEEPVSAHVDALTCRPSPLGGHGLYVADRLQSLLSEHLGLSAGFAPLLDEDVTYLAPGRDLIRGRAAVTALLRERDPAGKARLRWDVVRVDASADGRLGYTLGWTELRPEGPGGAVTYGKHIAAWRNRPGVGWRVVAFVEMAAPQLAPVPAPAEVPLFPAAASCAPGEDAAAKARAADAAFAARSVLAGLAASFRDFAAPDAVLRPGNRYVVGPDAIYALYAPIPPPPAVVLDWRPVIAQGAGSGDLAFTIGLATETDTADDGTIERGYSKYLTIWRRQPGGAWRYVTDGGNARPAP